MNLIAESAVTPARKAPRQRRSQRMVDLILEAAEVVLVQEGFEGAGTNRIAEVAGVSVGSLYQYFANKQEIIGSLVRKHADEMVSILTEQLVGNENRPIELMLRSIIGATIKAHKKSPALHKVIFEQVPRSGDFSHLDRVNGLVTQHLLTYLKSRSTEISVTNLPLAAFIVERTIEAVIHAAVAESSNLLDSALEEELVTMLSRYLVSR